jgi:capsular polysaccharide biosynthesis protein
MGRSKVESPPDGYYLTAQDWIAAMKLDPKKLLKEIHLDLTSPNLVDPKGLDKKTHWRLQSAEENSKPYRSGSITIIPNGRVCGIRTDILTSDHKLIWEFTGEKKIAPKDYKLFQTKSFPALEKTKDTVAVLPSKTSGAYYHWMLDILPCIHLLRKSGIKPDKYVINGKRLSPFHYASLEAFGISRHQVIESHKELHLQAKQLIIPRFTGGRRSKWICDFLKQELMTAKQIKPVKGYERIYISRANASKRKLLNEADVVSLLSKFGFKAIIMEHLPLKEQIRIFASAKVVAGPHGSGLTNLVFSKPGTKVIEFFSPLFVDKCFPVLSNLAGHDHYYVIGEGERPPEFTRPKDRRADMTINLNQLKKVLQMAGVK